MFSGKRGLIRGSRPGARRAAFVIAIITGVAATGLFIFEMVKGADEADKYGRITLPGKGTLELPKGRVALYYEERVTLPENSSLDAPAGIRVTARREETVKSEKAISNAINLDGRSLTEWGKLEIPEAGEYRITARSRERGSNSPAVTFGRGQLEGLGKAAIQDGIILAGGLGLSLLILLAGRRGYEGTPASVPVSGSWDPTPTPTTSSASGASGAPVASFGEAPPAAPVAGAPPGLSTAPVTPPSATGDPLEVQLRQLESQHKAGALSDEDYAERRQAAIDAAFKR